MSEADFTPENGWVVELEDAKTAAKTATKNGIAQLRVARAYFRLRQWQKCVAAAKTGLSQSPTPGIKKKLKDYAKKSESELAVKSEVDSRVVKRFLRDVMNDTANIDRSIEPHPSFKNTNLLQSSALHGDIRVVEALVAHGAAIDHGFMSSPPVVVPTTNTALSLLCACLAVAGSAEGAMEEFPEGAMRQRMREETAGHLECAKQLIRLGADTSARFQLPPSTTCFELMLFQHAGLSGKTVEQLAALSNKPDLIALIEEFKDEQSRLTKVHCRCGSRLPWKQCHAGGIGQAPHYVKSNGKILWRYSPSAMCPCQYSKKPHFQCCFLETAKPWYQDDRTGQLEAQVKMTNPAVGSVFSSYVQEMRSRGAAPDSPLFPGATSDNTRSFAVQAVRSGGLNMIVGMGVGSTRKSEILDWDREVYAGCLERLDNWFFWNDLHWQLEKSELLQRVKEWNDALEGYCSDKGLTGAARQAVVNKHRANPLAPCANPRCSVWEKEVKEFQRCGRCRKVAYCSRDCQVGDWKKHKAQCI